MRGHRTQLMLDESKISSLLSERLCLDNPTFLNITRKRGSETTIDTLISVDDSKRARYTSLGNEGKFIKFKDEIKTRFEITPLINPSIIVAIDVSSIKLGNTEHGILTAFRGCLVWKSQPKYHYYRYGPLIALMNDESCVKEYDEEKSPLGIRAISIMRNKFERAIQKIAVDIFKDSIILFDGSLTAGTPDNPVKVLNEIINIARRNDNAIIGVSKNTQVLEGKRKITELIDGVSDACIISLNEYMMDNFPKHPLHILGRVYIARLMRNGFTFRVDISTNNGLNTDLRSVRLLVGNELFDHGYPETLRLAHILSSFTSNEILGMRRYVFQKFGIELKDEFDVRKILFGPFSS